MTRVILWLIAITIVSFAIGFGIVIMTTGFPPSLGSFPNSENSVPTGGAKEADVSLSIGTGELNIHGGTGENVLIDRTTTSLSPSQESTLVTERGDRKIVSMTGPEQDNKTVISFDSKRLWNVGITGRIPVALDVRLGAGHSRFNAGGLNLTSLSVHTGAGTTDLDLTSYTGSDFTGTITNGFGDTSIRVPANRNIRIIVHRGVGDIKNDGMRSDGDYLVTDGYLPEPGTTLSVEQGVGTVRLTAVKP
jgi:hypothetical protein